MSESEGPEVVHRVIQTYSDNEFMGQKANKAEAAAGRMDRRHLQRTGCFKGTVIFLNGSKKTVSIKGTPDGYIAKRKGRKFRVEWKQSLCVFVEV